jgi:hypothetical protein
MKTRGEPHTHPTLTPAHYLRLQVVGTQQWFFKNDSLQWNEHFLLGYLLQNFAWWNLTSFPGQFAEEARVDETHSTPGSLAVMSREPITLRNLLMRASLQDQKVCVT